MEMENVFNNDAPYESAPPLMPRTLKERIRFYIHVLMDACHVIVIIVPYFLESIYYLFVNRPKKNIRNQVAVVTGGAHGIGRCIALELAAEGCKVAIVDIDGVGAQKTSDELKSMKVESVAYSVDVSDFEKVQHLRKQIEKDLGSVDILISNAGLMPLLSLREGTEKEIQRIVDVNILANLYLTRTFLPAMMQHRRGHIVCTSSMGALHPIPGAIIYTATKFAVHGFVQALAEELRQEGYGDCLKFTTLHPYFVSTRKDIMEAVDLRFPAISSEYTAKIAVDGILRNKRTVTIPEFNQLLSKSMSLLPLKVQQAIRDYILREKETRKVFVKDLKVNI